MLDQRKLIDLFKSAYTSPVVAMAWPGVVGCMACQNAVPWTPYAFECPHHRNQRQSRHWNESRRTPEST